MGKDSANCMVLRKVILISLLPLCLGLILAACTNDPSRAVRLTPTPTSPATETETASPQNQASSSSEAEPTSESGEVENSSQGAAPSATSDEANAAGDIEAGQHLFAEVCTPCHNHNAQGIEGIGVDLTQSQFVGGLTVSQLADFIKLGRGLNSPFNQSGIRMPARGGRPDLSDGDILNIAAYLQSLNTKVGAEADVAVAYLDWLEGGGEEEIEPIPEVSREGLSGPALDGQTTFLRFCAVCHGPHGEGVESLGKNLQKSDFVAGLSDEELAHFITVGRSVDDPLNTTGIQMLPYGGQPGLSETELTNLVAYLRALNQKGPTPELASADTGAGPDAAEAMAIIERTNPQCLTCHRIGDQGNDGPGPHLNGLAEVVSDYVPGLSAEEYIRQSILDPTTFLTPECPTGPCLPVMPNTYGQSLTDEEIDLLVKYILSLPPEK